MRSASYVLALVFVVACAPSPDPQASGPADQLRRPSDAPAASPLPQEFPVRFTAPRLVISKLGSPVPPPVLPGTAVDGSRIWSSAPDVVAVDPQGQLIGLRAGNAVVSSQDASIEITVAPAQSIQLSPGLLTLKPGETRRLRLLDERGREIAESEAEWLMDAPDVAFAEAGSVRAGRVGQARVVARYGGREAEARVRVAKEQ